MIERPLPVPPLRIPLENLPSRVGGYDRAATRKLFDELSASYEKLWLECAALRESEAELRAELTRRDELQPAGPASGDPSDSAEAIKEEARREAELALKKMRARAAKTARRLEREAKEKADEILSEARHDRQKVELEIERMQSLATETRDELSSFLIAALKWYKKGGGASTLDGDPLETRSAARDEHA